MASRHGCNDRPGALGEGLRAGACHPRPGGRYATTMFESTDGDYKSRHATDASTTIDARDILAGRYDDTTVRQAVEAGR